MSNRLPSGSNLHVERASVTALGVLTVVIGVASGGLLHGCGGEPSQSQLPIPCQNGCFPWEFCNTATGECEGADLANDLDAYEDFLTPDESEEPADDAEDMSQDAPLDPSADHPEDSLPGDQGFDATRDRSLDTIDSPPDVVTDAVTDRPDDSDGSLACPDRLELLEDNNTPEQASHLHDSLLTGQLAACGDNAFGACGSDCIVDGSECEVLTLARCGCCECDESSNLVLCGLEDPDHLSFDLLQGDPATLRVIPEAGTRRSDLIVVLEAPNGDRSLGSWVPTEDGGFMEIVIGAAAPGPTDPGVIATYVLKVQATGTEIIAYDVLIQVEPYSRECPHDSWDADWASYDEDALSEARCLHPGCTVDASSGGDIDLVTGWICPWDEVDVARHAIAGETPTDRRVQLRFDSAISNLHATLYRAGLEELVEIGELCPTGETACRDSTGIERVFKNLDSGIYQLRIWTFDTSPNDYEVFFFSDPCGDFRLTVGEECDASSGEDTCTGMLGCSEQCVCE
jgi:hypothetical protein